MKVRVNKAFYDIKERVSRVVGEVFDATQARIDEIMGVDPDLVEAEKPRAKKQAAEKKAVAPDDQPTEAVASEE